MTTTHQLIEQARAAGLRIQTHGEQLRVTGSDKAALRHFEPLLQARGRQALAILKSERLEALKAANARRSEDATEKALALLRRKRKCDRGEGMAPLVDCIIAIDNSGGIPIENLSDREAVRLFLHWLTKARREAAARRRADSGQFALDLGGAA